MSDFAAFSDDITEGMDVLGHFGILGQKWGRKNGPPYPLDSGDHSSGEKSAAKAAGVKVGSDSGKGSIANVKKKSSAQNQVKKPKKELTEEEKREAALKAVRAGDKKKIAKYAEYLTSQELQDADNRVRNLSNIKREEPGEKKLSKAELEKQEAIRSGDKEKVKQYADQMTYQELSEAMNKIDLTARLNYVPPEPTVMDKVQKFANNVDRFRDVAEKGVKAYNLMAQVYNASHKGETQWPIIGNQKKDGEKKDDKAKEETKKAVEQVAKEVKKSYEETAREKYENAKTDYKYDKKLENWKNKQQAKELKRLNKKNGDSDEEDDEPETTQEKQRQYTAEQAPQFKKSYFNSTPKEESKSSEPTEAQKRLVNEARKSDDQYLEQLRNLSNKSVDSESSWRDTWNSVSDVASNKSIYDDLTPAEEAYLNSFKR